MRLGLFALGSPTPEHNYPTSNTRLSAHHRIPSPAPVSDNPCRPRHYLADTELHKKEKKRTPNMQS